jgi:four helix bundle protein
MQRYEDLEIYKRAVGLSEQTSDFVSEWPNFHRDTLGKQLVRSADSIPANIAEGYGRYTFKERIRFCHFSRGSLYEYETHLRLALSRRLIDQSKYSKLKEETWALSRLLNGFIRYLRMQNQNKP